jgi:hypothetical protein
MSPKQKPNLAAALSEVSGSARRRSAPLPSIEATSQDHHTGSIAQGREETTAPAVYQAPSRAGTAPITGHFPRQVRDQLKILAIERGSTLYNLMAEAYNDLFAKYGKPEIAPHQMAEK